MTNRLAHYLETWALSDPHLLTTTPTSQIYIVNTRNSAHPQAVLKLLTHIGIREEGRGAIALKYWGGKGAIHLLNADKYAHLLEYADGEELIVAVEHDRDQEASAIAVDLIQQIHSVTAEIPRKGLVPLKMRFRALYNKAKQDHAEGIDSIYVRAAQYADAMFADRRDVTVLHGDIHHQNIRYKDGRGWLMFDPKGLIGERAYDAANMLCNPVDMPEVFLNEERIFTHAEIFAKGMGVDVNRVLSWTYLYACLSAAWWAGDENHPHEIQDLAVARIIEPSLNSLKS